MTWKPRLMNASVSSRKPGVIVSSSRWVTQPGVKRRGMPSPKVVQAIVTPSEVVQKRTLGSSSGLPDDLIYAMGLVETLQRRLPAVGKLEPFARGELADHLPNQDLSLRAP